MLEDLRIALRWLTGRPGPALVAVTCLSLGIGVNIALFGVLDALLFAPPAGVSDPASLVRVRVGSQPGPLARGTGPTASFEQYRIVAEQRADLFEGLAAYGRRDATLGGGEGARSVETRVVTANYFDVLGVSPRLGRFFVSAEGVRGAGVPVTVVSYRYWDRALGADPAVLGRTLRVNGVPLSVVGVAPEGFVGADLGDPDLWIPMGLVALPEFGGEGRYGPGSYWLQFVARLRPTLSLARARAVTAPARGGPDPFVAQPYDPSAASRSASLPISVLPLRTMFFEDQQGRTPIPPWALGISAAVLLLACATVANLLLAEAVDRRREVAIRLAVGGSPGRIVRQHLLRSALLATLAAGAATALAGVSVFVIRTLPVPPLPPIVNTRSLVFGAGVALLTPFLVGMIPALWSARRDVGEVLKERGGGVAAAARVQHGFTLAQTAIGFALLTIGGLFLRSFENVRAIDIGMDVDRVLMVYVDPRAGVEGGPGTDVVASSLDRIRALPEVEAAAVGGVVPFFMFTRSGFEIPDGRPDAAQPRSVLINAVDPEYLPTLGIGLVAGRGFDDEDRTGSPPVAIVSRELAQAAWGGRSPLGACIRLSRAPDAQCTEVVGVAADVWYQDPTGAPSAVLYLPSDQVPGGMTRTIFVRTRADPVPSIPVIRSAVQSLHPGMPHLRVEPLDARLRPKLLEWEVATKLFGAFGSLAALLGAAGLYVLVAFDVSRRTKELGIRSALGAGRPRLLGMIVLDGLKVCGIGIALGAGIAMPVAALLRSRLFGLGFADAPTYLAVAAGMMLIAVAASLIPAARATVADPAVVLRAE